MMGRPVSRQPKLFHVGFNLDDRVPADHPLRRIDRAIDFAFVRPMVSALYGYNGHASLDPALVLRLLFLCFHENVRSERELMRQLPLRLDWLWFCGLDLDEAAPDHSVLSKARRRWGERTFERVFACVLEQCRSAGLIDGRTVHADSTLLRADASLDGRVSRVLWEQLEHDADDDACETPDANHDARAEVETRDPDHDDARETRDTDADADDAPRPAADTSADTDGGTDVGKGTHSRVKLNDRLVSPVDPDAATSTRSKGGTTLGYRDHRLVDDHRGIVLATIATPADVDDGAMLPALLERQGDYTNAAPEEVVGDSMYGTRDNYTLLQREKIKAYLKKRRGKDSPKISWLQQLPRDCSPRRALHLLARRKSRAEGSFAEAHVRMNHRRCRWRTRWRVQIQCYLVAATQNLKKLANHLFPGNPVSLKQVASALAVTRCAA